MRAEGQVLQEMKDCPSKSVEEAGGRYSAACGRQRTLSWEAPEQRPVGGE